MACFGKHLLSQNCTPIFNCLLVMSTMVLPRHRIYDGPHPFLPVPHSEERNTWRSCRRGRKTWKASISAISQDTCAVLFQTSACIICDPPSWKQSCLTNSPQPLILWNRTGALWIAWWAIMGCLPWWVICTICWKQSTDFYLFMHYYIFISSFLQRAQSNIYSSSCPPLYTARFAPKYSFIYSPHPLSHPTLAHIYLY